MDDNALGIVMLLVIALAGIAATVFWIFMLINAAKREKWGWFVMQLIFGILVAIVYFFVEYEAPRARTGRRRIR